MILVLAAMLFLVPAVLFDFHIVGDNADYYEDAGRTKLLMVGFCASFVLEDKQTGCLYFARAKGGALR
jgi:hypothetical protein